MGKIVIIGGSIAGILLLVIGLMIIDYGTCFLINCETEIEIISFEGIQPIPMGDKVESVFVIKNNGEITAENCFLRWYIPRQNESYVNSEYFTLSPNEEITFNLKNTYDGKSNWVGNHCLDKSEFDMNSHAWVLCDNTDSERFEQKIFYQCPLK